MAASHLLFHSSTLVTYLLDISWYFVVFDHFEALFCVSFALCDPYCAPTGWLRAAPLTRAPSLLRFVQVRTDLKTAVRYAHKRKTIMAKLQPTGEKQVDLKSVVVTGLASTSDGVLFSLQFR